MLTQPKIIEDIHRAYLEAGADIIETDTFNGTAMSMGSSACAEHVAELNATAAELARRSPTSSPADPEQAAVRRRQHRPDQQAALHGDPRPRSRPRDVTLRPDGRHLQEQVRGPGRRRCRHPAAGDVLRHAGPEGVPVRDRPVLRGAGDRLPVMISGTIFDSGRTLSVQPIEAF